MLAILGRVPLGTIDSANTLVRFGKLTSDFLAIIVLLAKLTSDGSTVYIKSKAPSHQWMHTLNLPQWRTGISLDAHDLLHDA